MSHSLSKAIENPSFARLVLPWVAGLLLIGVFDLFGNGAVCAGLKVFILICGFFVPLESLFYALLILAPNDSMLAISGFISLTSAIVVVFLIRVLLRHYDEIKIDRALLVSGVLLILDALVRVAIVGENYFTGSVKIVLSFLAVALYCSLRRNSWETNDVRRLLTAFLLGCVVMTVLALLNFYYFDLNYDRMRPVEGDPNYLSLYLCVCIALLFLWIFEGKVEGVKLILLCVTAFLFIVGGLLSQSRGFIVAFVPVVVYLFLQLPKRLGRKPLLVILFIVLLCITMYLLMNGQNSPIDEVIARFTSENTSGGSGRTTIWMTYIRAWSSDLGMFFLGVPQTALGDLWSKVATGGVVAVHNLYLELLCQQGFLFTICFAAIIIRLAYLMPRIVGAWRNVPLMSLLVGYCFLSGALSVTLPFVFFIAWVGSSYFMNGASKRESLSDIGLHATDRVDAV